MVFLYFYISNNSKSDLVCEIIIELGDKKYWDTKNMKSKDNEIEELKEKNHSLKNTLEFWKDNFLRVMSLIKDKLFDKEKEREKYFDVSKDLYKKGIIKEETFDDLKDTYRFSKEHDDKGKDDLEIEI